MRITASLIIAGILIATFSGDAFARGGRGGGGGGGGGRGGGWGGGGGGRSFSGGGFSGGRSYSGGGRSFSGGSPRIYSGGGNWSGGSRTFSGNMGRPGGGNFNQGMRSQSLTGSRGFSGGNTSYYRGGNFGRNNSAFFGTGGAFNNAYLGNRNFNNYGNYGRGFGYGGYRGYGGYGLGYGGYGFLPFLGGLGLGYGLGGYGLGGYGLGYGGYYNNSYPAYDSTVIANDAAPPADQSTVDQNAGEYPTNPPTSNGTDYVALGESDFRAGQYPAAIGAFRHALIDEPNNAGLMLMLAQTLFQIGQWQQAAGATELAMGALPEDKWGTIVQNYTQLYGNIGDYTAQLKQLEAAVKQKPEDPALRFLLGYHYGYLNYPQQAVRELGKAVELEGRDPAARRLHDVFAAKTGAPQVGPVPQTETTPPGAGAPAGTPPATSTGAGPVVPESAPIPSGTPAGPN